jgi:hypothetical protein
MNTLITRNRWTYQEVNLAKLTLKLAKGDQTKAAMVLSEKLDRSIASIKVKLCTLAKKHPSLRKVNIAKRIAKADKTIKPNTVVKVKEFVIEGNKLIITF